MLEYTANQTTFRATKDGVAIGKEDDTRLIKWKEWDRINESLAHDRKDLDDEQRKEDSWRTPVTRIPAAEVSSG